MSDARKAHDGPSQAVTDHEVPHDQVQDTASTQQPSSPEQPAPGNGRSARAPQPSSDEPTPEAAAPASDSHDEPVPEPTSESDTEEPAEEDELTRALRERDEYLDHLRRERAEFENFRKRTARDKLEAMDRGVQSLLTELLGVLDDFGHVLAAAEDSSDPALAKGVTLVHNQLIGVLTRFGLEEVPGEGEPFDPQWHEAMMQVPADEGVDEPVVAQVLRPGYRFRGRVIRPASVSVAQ